MNLKQARLLCAHSTVYELLGQSHVLMAGQAVPIYDGVSFRKIGPKLEIVLAIVSVDENNEFIPQPGAPVLRRELYRLAKENCAAGAAQDEDRMMVRQASLFELGGATHTVILRPHRMAMGIGLFNTPISWDDQRSQHEYHPMTMEQADPICSKLVPSRSSLLPLPRLYMEAADGDYEAVAIGEERDAPVRLKELLLPVSPCPLGKDVDADELLVKAIRHIQAMGSGKIWLGEDLQKVGAQPFIYPDPVTVEHVKTGQAVSPTLYSLPHGLENDYYAPLRQETKAKVNALYQGRNHLGTDLLPMNHAGMVLQHSSPVAFGTQIPVFAP